MRAPTAARRRWRRCLTTARSCAPRRRARVPGAAAPAAAAKKAASRASLHDWRETAALRFPAVTFHAATEVAAWVRYPGLFAGGGLDVMTAALCRALPAPPPRARVLDFASGSGALAAALLARAPTLRVHLLDADAVAIAAARENVPTAARCFVCAGWPPLTSFKKRKPKRYDLIVSNPPVHAGQPDDFGVLVTMIRGARRRLRNGGRCGSSRRSRCPPAASSPSTADLAG